MNKKRIRSKLHLSRETVRHLNPQELAGAVGGIESTSNLCSDTCTATSGYPRSQCICPQCPNHTEYCDTTGPIWTSPVGC